MTSNQKIKRTLNGLMPADDQRVYIDVRDVIELLRAAGYDRVADRLNAWEDDWRNEYARRRLALPSAASATTTRTTGTRAPTTGAARRDTPA